MKDKYGRHLHPKVSTPEEMAGLLALCLEVFVQEQCVLEKEEMDSLDQTEVHAVVWEWREVVATGLIVLLAGAGAQIGSMAVRASLGRGGIAGDALRFLECEAKARGGRRILLHAQTYVVSFYSQYGYLEEGLEFQEASIEHILMRKYLPSTQATF